ncbi:hypothetical protein [Nocardia aurantiaca]|uniref:Uncharacterized protein n=1 Tax=Nocardia aurantiaca TaxID=2675850 RepID=A0A6I3KRR6_9NOCA|nr:hypothetical protein [Nocardia aurantiaca]MTE13443.1 hypothetical protein [Nocardia aurantiaca]
MRPTRHSLTIAHIIGIGVGLVLLIVGIVRLFLPLECSGHALEAGQVCHDTVKGRAVVRTFDEQRSLRDTTDGFLIVGGLVVVTGSAVLLHRTTRP